MMNNFRSDLDLFGTYLTKTFKDIFPDSTTFINEYSGTEDITDDSLKVTFRLLYARFGNSSITNMDENQWKAKVYSVLFMYGPSWQKRLDIQKMIRTLTPEEIATGNKTVYNHAMNPGYDTPEDKILNTINDQNTSAYTLGKVAAFDNYLDVLKTDVTKTFIDRFENLFLTVVKPQNKLLYMTEEETPWNF